jgi:hypothetical protein
VPVCSPPWQSPLELDLEGEAEERPNQYDQSERQGTLHRRVDRDREHEVGDDQDLQAEQDRPPHPPTNPSEGSLALPTREREDISGDRGDQPATRIATPTISKPWTTSSIHSSNVMRSVPLSSSREG